MIYLFDVDGTLTPSREKIHPEFANWFLDFINSHTVCLITGSDLEKTIEQLGTKIVDSVEYCFNCAGNSIYQRGNIVYKSNWVCPDEPWEFLENYLYQKSNYHFKYGRHFEQRIGLLNFSVVGRNAVGKQRTDYYEWDKIHNERSRLVKILNERWPNIQSTVGGETGIDIFERGKDKAQILDIIKGEVRFFGDRIDPEGNDYSLAMRIEKDNRGQYYKVTDWNHTWSILKQLKESE